MGMSNQSERLQSAMEYLMTYGWAILIIAVVLGALFQLGIFNASTFTPKAPPGACHVFRPNGPGTTSFINTQGICNGELPQYVAHFSSNIYHQNYITFAGTLMPTGSGSLSSTSISIWMRSTESLLYPNLVGFGGSGVGNSMTLSFYNGYAGIDCGGCGGYAGGLINDNAWHFIGISFVGGSTSANIYVDGKSAGAGYVAFGRIPNLLPGTGWIGDGGNPNTYVGYLANIQIYNTSLSSNEITALYNEGIGGAPVKLSNLVAWWPLNGDVKDYSGNNNNGVPTGISFTSSWESGYSAP